MNANPATDSRRTEAVTPNTRKLFSRSAAVLGRPRRTVPWQIETEQRQLTMLQSGNRDECLKGAAEDGRAPTEERSCVRGRCF